MHLNLFRRLLTDRGGATAIVIAATAAVLIAFTSLGVEVVEALQTQRRMQAAADSAALAAARALHVSYPSPYQTEGFAVAAKAGFDDNQQTGCSAANPLVYVGSPCAADVSAATTTTCASNNCVEVLIKQPFDVTLARAVGFDAGFTLHGIAVATFEEATGCAAILDPTSSGAFKVNGGAAVSVVGCTIWVNSSNTTAGAATVTGGATLSCPDDPDDSTLKGGLHVVGTSSPTADTLTSAGCKTTINEPAIADPYAGVNPSYMTSPSASLPTVTAANCPGVANCKLITPVSSTNPDGLTPVFLNGGVKVGNSETWNFCPGVYVIDGNNGPDGFKANPTNGTIQLLTSTTDTTFTTDCGADAGTGIAFVLTSSGSSSKIPNVQTSSGAIIGVVAAASPCTLCGGPLGGIDQTQADQAGGLPRKTLFFQNRNASSTASSAFSGTQHLDGVLYFPTQSVTITGNSVPTAQCFEIISWQLQVGGSPSLTAKACDPGFPIGGNATLIQ